MHDTLDQLKLPGMFQKDCGKIKYNFSQSSVAQYYVGTRDICAHRLVSPPGILYCTAPYSPPNTCSQDSVVQTPWSKLFSTLWWADSPTGSEAGAVLKSPIR